MRKNWLLLSIALLLAVFAIGAAACGGDGDGDGDGTADDGVTPDVNEVPDTVIVFAGVLADTNGNTLYVFDEDEAGVSNCIDDCLRTWVPLSINGEPTGGDGVGELATIERDDDRKQVTHNGQPLYYFTRDTGAGDQSGDGINGLWHLVAVGE